MTKVMTIDGMMCGHCEGRVRKALEAVDGVEAVATSLADKTAAVELGRDVPEEELVAAVTGAGYGVREVSVR